MGRSESDPHDARRLVEAAAWRVHLTEAAASEANVVEFEEWLAADARNQAAWRQVDGPWQLFGEQATAPEVMVARRAALEEAQRAGRRRWHAGPFFRSATGRAIAASILALVAGALLIWQQSRPEVYRTAGGERRTVTLADGSMVVLDAQTEVRVRYSDTGRNLALVRGQAQFDVAHDVERPFAVAAGGQRVIATGTSFNVDMVESNLFVTLIQGHVVVIPKTEQLSVPGGAGAAGQAGGALRRGGHVELNAGEQLVISPTGPPRVSAVDVDRATAWQSGRLVLENETLASVAARLNRYSKHPFRVIDQRTAQLRISGVFNTNDTDGFVSTITTYFPVTARSDRNGEIELRLR